MSAARKAIEQAAVQGGAEAARLVSEIAVLANIMSEKMAQAHGGEPCFDIDHEAKFVLVRVRNRR